VYQQDANSLKKYRHFWIIKSEKNEVKNDPFFTPKSHFLPPVFGPTKLEKSTKKTNSVLPHF